MHIRTQLRSFFPRRLLLIAGGWSLFLLAITLYGVYAAELGAISKAAQKRLGADFSAGVSVGEVFASAGVGWLQVCFGFGLIFLTACMFLALWKSTVQLEPHSGWRRLAIVFAILMALYGLFFVGAKNVGWWINVAVAFAALGLGLLKAARWVVSGFQPASTGLEQETSTEKTSVG
jgi:hypothetical protein